MHNYGFKLCSVSQLIVNAGVTLTTPSPRSGSDICGSPQRESYRSCTDLDKEQEIRTKLEKKQCNEDSDGENDDEEGGGGPEMEAKKKKKGRYRSSSLGSEKMKLFKQEGISAKEKGGPKRPETTANNTLLATTTTPPPPPPAPPFHRRKSTESLSPALLPSSDSPEKDRGKECIVAGPDKKILSKQLDAEIKAAVLKSPRRDKDKPASPGKRDKDNGGKRKSMGVPSSYGGEQSREGKSPLSQTTTGIVTPTWAIGERRKKESKEKEGKEATSKQEGKKGGSERPSSGSEKKMALRLKRTSSGRKSKIVVVDMSSSNPEVLLNISATPASTEGGHRKQDESLKEDKDT